MFFQNEILRIFVIFPLIFRFFNVILTVFLSFWKKTTKLRIAILLDCKYHLTKISFEKVSPERGPGVPEARGALEVIEEVGPEAQEALGVREEVGPLKTTIKCAKEEKDSSGSTKKGNKNLSNWEKYSLSLEVMFMVKF